MQISDLINNPRLFIEETKSRTLESLKPGQTVRATVIMPTRDNIARLKIGSIEVLVRTPIGLEKGQQLNINVVKTGNNPELSLLRESGIQELQARLFRAVVPRQQPLQPFLNRLRALFNPTALLQRDRPSSTAQPVIKGAEVVTTSSQPTPAAKGEVTRAMPPFTQAWRGLTTPAVLITTLKQMLQSAQPHSPAPKQHTDQPGRLPASDRNPSDAPNQLKQPLRTTVAQTRDVPVAYRTALGAARPEQLSSVVNTARPSSPESTIKTGIAESRTTPSQQHLSTPTSPDIKAVTPGVERSVSPELLQAVKRLLSHGLVEGEQITPERLRRSIEASGLFLEAGLARNSVPPNDFKASLLHLLLLLRPPSAHSPATRGQQRQQAAAGQQQAVADGALGRFLTELLGQTESALARVQMHQLASVPVDEQPKQAWQIEVPVNNADSTDSFMLRIARESRTNDGEQETLWTVSLNFDLENLGPVKALLTLSDDVIYSHFLAREPDSAVRIEQALPKLDQAFQRAGLKVGSISARRGEPDTQDIDLPNPKPLLDEKA
ncbi:MAG: flagellar hook-length control protein FliK [Candidatus Sedimenticola sp. 6PFRAG5]